MRTNEHDDFEPGLVSVIIPTKDRAWVICDALQSVYRQIYRPIEVLVVDDGSVDETESVVADWMLQIAGDEHFTIQYVKQQPAGAPAARNRGFAASHGQFIQFLDSDDLLHPEKLRDQVKILNDNSDIDYVYSGAAVFRTVVDWEAASEGGRPDSATLAMQIGTPRLTTLCGIYRRQICEMIGPWDELLVKWQDWEYNVRLLAAGAQCVGIAPVHSLIRLHEAGQIADLSRTRNGLEAMAHAITKVEAGLIENGRCDTAVSEALAARWSLVAAEAIRSGHPRIAASAIRSGLRHTSSAARTLRLNVLRLLAFLPPALGSTACKKVLAMVHARSSRAVDLRDHRAAQNTSANVAL